MALYYVSDLHLRDEREIRGQCLVAFIEQVLQPGDFFVLGGDIFDLFVGNKAFFRQSFSQILAALRSASTRGVKVFYLQGNHDFHMEGIFAGLENIQILDDDFALEWNGKKIWVSHGDQINRQDHGYLMLRWFTRSWFFRALLYCVPGAWIAKIGQWSSKTSRKYTSVDRAISDRVQATRNLFRDYAQSRVASGADLVLIGHSHIADQQSFKAAARSGDYLNLGYDPERLLLLAWQNAAAPFVVKTWSPGNK